MKYLCRNKSWKINKDYNVDKLLYLLIDRPNRKILFYDFYTWLNDDEQWHRDYNLPAKVFHSRIEWFINDVLTITNYEIYL